MKRISSKPANGEVDPDLAHQLTVVNDAGRPAKGGKPMLTGRWLGVPRSPPAILAPAGMRMLGRPGQMSHNDHFRN
jgi:hypothetical protein